MSDSFTNRAIDCNAVLKAEVDRLTAEVTRKDELIAAAVDLLKDQVETPNKDAEYDLEWDRHVVEWISSVSGGPLPEVGSE